MTINFDIQRYLLSIVLLVVSALFVPQGKRDLSDINFMTVMIFFYVPLTSMFGFNSQIAIGPILISLFAIAVSLIFIHFPFIPILPLARNGERRAIYISATGVLASIAWSIHSGVIFHINLDLVQM